MQSCLFDDVVWIGDSTNLPPDYLKSGTITEKLQDRCTYTVPRPLADIRHRGSRFGGSKDHSRKQKILKKRKQERGMTSRYHTTISKAIEHHIAHQKERGIDTRKTESSVNQV
jgi:hypothetical protein